MSRSDEEGFHPHPGDPWHPEWAGGVDDDDTADDDFDDDGDDDGAIPHPGVVIALAALALAGLLFWMSPDRRKGS